MVRYFILTMRGEVRLEGVGFCLDWAQMNRWTSV